MTSPPEKQYSKALWPRPAAYLCSSHSHVSKRKMQRHPSMADSRHHVSAPFCCLPSFLTQVSSKCSESTTSHEIVAHYQPLSSASFSLRSHLVPQNAPWPCALQNFSPNHHKIQTICSYQPEYPYFLLALFAFLTVYVKPIFFIKSPIHLKKTSLSTTQRLFILGNAPVQCAANQPAVAGQPGSICSQHRFLPFYFPKYTKMSRGSILPRLIDFILKLLSCYEQHLQ